MELPIHFLLAYADRNKVNVNVKSLNMESEVSNRGVNPWMPVTCYE